jgi:hypothetical protein
MLKNLFSSSLLFTGLFFSSPLFAQSKIQWDRSLGGGDLTVTLQTSDGGYLVGGSTFEGISEFKSEAARGELDFWVVKVSATGVKEWDKTIGGPDTDFLKSVRQTADGGYILGGQSLSNKGGDKTENNKSTTEAGFAMNDMWIVKLSANGTKEWDRTLGSDLEDYFTSVSQTLDGGYVVAGSSQSNVGGDKSEGPKGIDFDYWVVKVDANGSKLWDNTIGGTGNDMLAALEPLADGGFILGGTSSSDAGVDKSEDNVGGAWIVNIASSGLIVWDKTVPGSGSELISIHQTADAGYILGGSSNQLDTGKDYWIAKLTADRLVEWLKTFTGATFEDPSHDIHSNDVITDVLQTAAGDYLAAGTSDSGAGIDKTTANNGDLDIWLVKLKANGDKVWDQTIGGLSYDGLRDIQQTTDGGFILGVTTRSGAGADKTEQAEGYWIIKLEAEDPLPVTLASFSVKKETSVALLTWQTTSETRTDRFEIEHSFNGRNWNQIMTIKAQGESTQEHTYQFVHSTPANGRNYYRLKMIDTDLSFTYSKIEDVSLKPDFDVAVFPNPTTEVVKIQVTDWSKISSIQILNFQGKELYHSGEKPVKEISTKSFDTGSYFVKIKLVDGTETSKKLVVRQ